MNTAAELHQVNLVSSSKLKLRATALLAEGTEATIFDACVLFHEAARLERRAVDALSPCPPETRLAGSIEECWCLIEGCDPDAAAGVWSRILDEAQQVDHATAESMLGRLRPRYDRYIREFSRAVQDHPQLRTAGQTQVLVPSSLAERKKMLHGVHALLKQFPGLPAMWAGASHLAHAIGDRQQAWGSLQRALELAPDVSGFRALSLVAAAETLKPAEADRHLKQAYADLHQADAQVCLMYAFGELILSQRLTENPTLRWKRALEAVNAAFPKSRSEWLAKSLKGLRLFLEAAISKRKADPDLLYRAGLGRLAATSPGKPIDALLADATARVSAMAGPDAAA
ncbi:MAG TPA: hypothetical protein VJN18_23815 [Polyangiaceae bacterium]|nr:hypothetical protein [Polyangiaceae bacterium]